MSEAKMKRMKLGENPAAELTDGLFALECGDDHCDDDQQEDVVVEAQTTLAKVEDGKVEPASQEDIQLAAQGLGDMWRFLDREVIDKVIEFIKAVDVEQIKGYAMLVTNMIETAPNGDVFLNLRVKIKDGDPSDGSNGLLG